MGGIAPLPLIRFKEITKKETLYKCIFGMLGKFAAKIAATAISGVKYSF